MHFQKSKLHKASTSLWDWTEAISSLKDMKSFDNCGGERFHTHWCSIWWRSGECKAHSIWGIFFLSSSSNPSVGMESFWKSPPYVIKIAMFHYRIHMINREKRTLVPVGGSSLSKLQRTCLWLIHTALYLLCLGLLYMVVKLLGFYFHLEASSCRTPLFEQTVFFFFSGMKTHSL